MTEKTTCRATRTIALKQATRWYAKMDSLCWVVPRDSHPRAAPWAKPVLARRAHTRIVRQAGVATRDDVKAPTAQFRLHTLPGYPRVPTTRPAKRQVITFVLT